MKRWSWWEYVGLSILTAGLGCGRPKPAQQPAPNPSSAVVVPMEPTATSPAKDEVEAITKAPYGKIGDRQVDSYTLTNRNGVVMKVITYGAIVTELHVPDKNGKLADVVAGFESLEKYVAKNPYMGAAIGRIANRIKDAKFTLEGKPYVLAANAGPHHLHGGKQGWDKVLWNAEPKETPQGPALALSYVSEDGEEGFPGRVTVALSYTLTHENELVVDAEATTDKTTIVGMAHHSYWNLGGYDSGTILDHELMIAADKYTPVKVFHPKSDPVPYGAVEPVTGTPFDFTVPKPIGRDNQAVKGNPIGYDHNWVVNGDPKSMRLVAKVKDPKSGRVMTVLANQPGVQFYAGTFLDGTLEGKGTKYPQYGAFCIETQAFPNAINVPEWRDQVILRPGETYKHTMIHRFTSED